MKDFYRTEKWRTLRQKVLDTYGKKCMRCKATPYTAIIEVDHILPRVVFPSKELEFSNLQVLCRRCNQAKGWKGRRDYRPRRFYQKLLAKTVATLLVIILLAAVMHIKGELDINNL